MGATVLVREATLSGATLNEWSLEAPTEKVTVRELIRSYVYQGFRDQQDKVRTRGCGPVEPTDYEKRLNPPPASRASPGESPSAWEEEFDKASKAFREGRLLVLTGDHQQESLDDEIVVRADTKVTFIKLVLLVGG